MSDVKKAAEEYVGFSQDQWTGEISHSAKAFLAGAAWQVERVLEELNMVRSYFTEEDARPGADNILGQAICAVERICDKKHKTQSCDTSRSITPSGTPENK